MLREVYAEPIALGTPVVVGDLATAELAKSAANAFLATKISFINAMAELCEATGADVTLLADALGHDPRIGRQFLNAGLGFGGGCLPKDIRGFMARAGELGAGDALTFLREVDAINQRRRVRVVDMAAELLDRPWPGSKVAVLGAAFKPDSDDIRDSPALNVAGRLHLLGAHVTVHDPRATGQRPKELADAELRGLRSRRVPGRPPRARAHRVGAVLRARAGHPHRGRGDSRHRGRAELPGPGRWSSAGWTYRALGRPLLGTGRETGTRAVNVD